MKLEGAAIVGYRTIFIGGMRDPILIGQLDSFLDNVRKRDQGHLSRARRRARPA